MMLYGRKLLFVPGGDGFEAWGYNHTGPDQVMNAATHKYPMTLFASDGPLFSLSLPSWPFALEIVSHTRSSITTPSAWVIKKCSTLSWLGGIPAATPAHECITPDSANEINTLQTRASNDPRGNRSKSYVIFPAGPVSRLRRF
jgi:hypothetical protein